MADVISGTGTMHIAEIIRDARERGSSDVHIPSVGVASFRIDGELSRRDDAAVNADELSSFLAECVDEAAQNDLLSTGSCDVVLRDGTTSPVRVHLFRTIRGLQCAARLLPPSVPSLESLDVPSAISELALRESGLFLVVGPSGSGKTTLLAAVVDYLNRSNARHILILEDPVEYVHAPNRCVITQCEIGSNAPDFATSIHAALRADPDVIVIGEVRDTDSLRNALSAAETGHLVMATMHTMDAPGAVERIVDSFPVDARDQIRVQLAQSLVGICALRLIPRALACGRRAVVELLVATDGVRNLIREGKLHQLRSVMQTGRSASMQTFEMHLSELLHRGEITAAAALRCAIRPLEITFGSRDRL